LYTGFWWGNQRERNRLEDPGVDERILRWIFKKRNEGGMDWIDMDQDKDMVKTVMKLRVPQNARNFLTS
jgi:hypothetical protein